MQVRLVRGKTDKAKTDAGRALVYMCRTELEDCLGFGSMALRGVAMVRYGNESQP